MFVSEKINAVFRQARRSGFHRLINLTLPYQPAPEAGYDVFGSVMVVSLSACVVVLMRLLLAD